MPRSKNDEIVIRRNKAIVKDFKKLCDIKTPKGKSLYTYEYVLEKLEDKYYLAAATIHNIVTGRTFKEE